MVANPQKYLGIKFYDQLIGGHREWLMNFDKEYLNLWDRLFKYHNSEAALCEAGTRQLLQESDINVEPYQIQSDDRNPDFKCSKDNKLFYVDATCVMSCTATRKSKLDDFPYNQKATFYSLLTKQYFNKARSKVTQFKDLRAPCIVAIGTLHFQAGALCFDEKSAEEILTGKKFITSSINVQTGKAIGEPYNSSSLEGALFLQARRIICDELPIQPIRQTVSSVLLCPFGTHPIKCIGILHPKPNYVFDRSLLSRIKFCRLKTGWESGDLIPEWI